MSASVAAMNAISAGILALSARRWGGDDRVRAIDTTVVVLQLVLLCGESGAYSSRNQAMRPVSAD